MDYNRKGEKKIAFLKIVQNKLLRAISQNTAAELAYLRVAASLPFLGMQLYDKKEARAITKTKQALLKITSIKTKWSC